MLTAATEEETFDRARIAQALQALGRRLAAAGKRGDMYIVGGEALALAYDARRVTQDVDAVFEPKMLVYRLAGEVAGELGLPADWLNDAVKGFMLGPDAAAAVIEMPGLRVQLTSPLVLLAMKVHAARVSEDEDDVLFLADLCGFATAADVLGAVAPVIGESRMRPLSKFFVEALFDG